MPEPLLTSATAPLPSAIAPANVFVALSRPTVKVAEPELVTPPELVTVPVPLKPADGGVVAGQVQGAVHDRVVDRGAGIEGAALPSCSVPPLTVVRPL